MSRRILQIVNLILAILTVGLAAGSLILGTSSPIYDAGSVPSIPNLDSNLRFMGGMGLTIGLALIWITPSIERQTAIFRVAWLSALFGGIGRLMSMVLVGPPALPMVIFTLFEVPGVPLLLYWQSKVANEYGER